MSTSTAMAERYGAPAPWRRRSLVITVAVVVLAFAGWLTWTVWEQSRPVVSSEQIGFRVLGDNSAEATVQVQFRGSDVQAECTLDAYAADHTLVGTVDFRPDPHAAGTTYTVPVQTERRATSVQSIGCIAPGQPRPR